MDPYLLILKQHTEDPLIEMIIELKQQLEDTVKAATASGNFQGNNNPL